MWWENLRSSEHGLGLQGLALEQTIPRWNLSQPGQLKKGGRGLQRTQAWKQTSAVWGLQALEHSRDRREGKVAAESRSSSAVARAGLCCSHHLVVVVLTRWALEAVPQRGQAEKPGWRKAEARGGRTGSHWVCGRAWDDGSTCLAPLE